MASAARQPAVTAVGSSDGDARVTPYETRGVRRRQVCHTRVQGLGVGGQLSKVSVSNVTSGENSPYGTYSASTLVPEQLPAPLDSARNEIGQCADGDGGGCWTAPATKSDSLSIRRGSGRAGGWPGPGGAARRVWAVSGDGCGGDGQGAGESGGGVVSALVFRHVRQSGVLHCRRK